MMGQIDRGQDIKVLGASKSIEEYLDGFNLRRQFYPPCASDAKLGAALTAASYVVS